MEPMVEVFPSNHPTMSVHASQSVSRSGFYQTGFKRLKFSGSVNECGNMAFPASMPNDIEQKKPKTSPEVIDYRNPFAIPNLLESLDSGKYGSVTKDIEALIARKMQMLHPYYAKYPKLSNAFMETEEKPSNGALKPATHLSDNNVIDLEDDDIANNVKAVEPPVVVIDSDEEDDVHQKTSVPFQEIVLARPAGQFLMKDFLDFRVPLGHARKGRAQREEAIAELEIKKEKGVYVGVEDEDNHQTDPEDDGLEDVWKEMTMALECSKDAALDPSPDEQLKEGGEYCDHSFVLKDDLGYVCRICGVIDREILSSSTIRSKGVPELTCPILGMPKTETQLAYSELNFLKMIRW